MCKPIMPIINTNVNYTYSLLEDNLSLLKNYYPFINVFSIGNSVMGKSIFCIRFGTGPKEIFYSASIHANEWISSVILMKFLENLCDGYLHTSSILNINIASIFESCSLYICPMLNPDGVDLVTGSIDSSSHMYKKVSQIASNYPNIPFPSGWKANINGVDLNLQFPAGWEKAKKIKYAQGYIFPAPRDFVGKSPLCEPESQAIYNFTLKHNFNLILCYHTQGEVIYWQFQDYMPENSLEIGKNFAKISGYSLEETPYNSSFAGLKDWFIKLFNKPGFTIEAGFGENPLSISQFKKIYSDNIGILMLGCVL